MNEIKNTQGKLTQVVSEVGKHEAALAIAELKIVNSGQNIQKLELMEKEHETDLAHLGSKEKGSTKSVTFLLEKVPEVIKVIKKYNQQAEGLNLEVDED